MSDLFGNHIVGTHMTSLFSCGKLCVIGSVMTTRVLTFFREYVIFIGNMLTLKDIKL